MRCIQRNKAAVVRERAIYPMALLDQIERGEPPAVLDVRSPAEFAEGHVPGAMNVPFTSVLAGSLDVRARRSETVVLYCGHGPRAWLAGEALRWRGYLRVTYLRGHMAAWRRAGLREERG
jgi:rhodanese-related sulfurtransferase